MMNPRRKTLLSTVGLAATLGTQILRAQTPAPPHAITLDGASFGRTFEGLGAVSGGGNTSRLLPDYPDAPRKQILDYLFKPQFAGSLS